MMRRTVARAAPVVLLLASLTLLLVGSLDLTLARALFIRGTYGILTVSVLCWIAAYLRAAPALDGPAVRGWLKGHYPGLLVATIVTVVASQAIEPALRILSDEANLIGTSKNLFASRTATFTVSGKYYYDTFWDVDVALDRRPTLFPYLVSLVHTALGYSYRNAFRFNLLVLPGFVLTAYRLAKALGGAAFGVVAALLVAAHPATLLGVRSGGFDFFAAFFALWVLNSLFDHCQRPSSSTLTILWMNLCLFAEIRYEGVLFIPPILALLLLLRRVSWGHVRDSAAWFALTPLYLAPRVWQAALLGNVPEQDPGAVAFSVAHVFENVPTYFASMAAPLDPAAPHGGLVIALGLGGTVLALGSLVRLYRARGERLATWHFGAFVVVWMSVLAVISWSYVWGRAQHPSAARLFIPLDTYFSFAAAWFLVWAFARWRWWLPILPAAALFALAVPVAAQHRAGNRLTQTRENATTWRFFESLHEKRILIVTDRPSHFTIMDYGAMTFDAALNDPYLFTALSRRLFYDIYVIQQIQLSSNEPLPGYQTWPSKKLAPVLEFQNDANVLVRISRVKDRTP